MFNNFYYFVLFYFYISNEKFIKKENENFVDFFYVFFK